MPESIVIDAIDTPPLFKSDSPTVTFTRIEAGKIRLRSTSIEGGDPASLAAVLFWSASG